MSIHHHKRDSLLAPSDDGHSISRATSVSRRSTMSKNQALIKKNTTPHELRPSDVLIERFTALRGITKMLLAYFEGIADIQNNTARELTKLGAVIQVPFKAGNQFLGEDGLQDIYYNIRDKTRIIADHHANLGKTIEGSICQHLQKLSQEIKAHIRNVQNDTGRLASSVAKERELSTKIISDLARSISVYKNTPMSISPKEDPFIQNQAVFKQLQRQVNEENALQKSIIIMQQNSAHFEEGIIRSLQSAWQTYDEWQSRMSTSVQDTWRTLGQNFAGLSPDREWIAFAARSDHLLDPDTPLRNPEHIDYPSKEDPSVVPVHVGLLERKRRFTRHYRESYFVLTAAGFLHEYNSSDPLAQTSPTFSLFLPACTLGPPSSANTARSHKFHIETQKDSSGLIKTGSILGKRTQSAYTFRARSHEELMEWWNDLRMLVARYLVASESVERSGPIAAAVRSAGYLSEEEEEEEDGSSVEEEEEEDEDVRNYQVAHDRLTHDEAVPAYSQPHKDIGVEIGPNGYAVEKKPYLGDASGAGPSSNAGDGGADLGRRLSRKQEKAPEGQEPHDVPDGRVHSIGENDHPVSSEPIGAGFFLPTAPAPVTSSSPAASASTTSPPQSTHPGLSTVKAPAPLTTASAEPSADAAGPAPVDHQEHEHDRTAGADAGAGTTSPPQSSGLISKFKELIH